MTQASDLEILLKKTGEIQMIIIEFFVTMLFEVAIDIIVCLIIKHFD